MSYYFCFYYITICKSYCYVIPIFNNMVISK